ncbi:MAG TPA: hypothetical protein VI790_03630 [Candidatus Nanoarchaeia archaeon]|nr:hypothetical protein [Candidatus Nanoarchaeia archaeon]
MSRFERFVKKIESLDADRKSKASKIASLEDEISGLTGNSVNFEFSALADYVIPAVALVTGGAELIHTQGIKGNVVNNLETNPNINWTNYFNETTGEQIKSLPPEVLPAFYESPWAAFLLQQGVNVACAINLGLTYAEFKGALGKLEKLKKGLWLGVHGAAAVISKYFTWGKGVASKDVSVPETVNGEPNLTAGTITFDSYLNGVIASGIALGFEGACAYHGLSKLFKSLKNENVINSLEDKIIGVNREKSEITDSIEEVYERAIMELDISDYDTNVDKQKTLGKLLLARYPVLADSKECDPNIIEFIDDASAKSDFKTYADNFSAYDTSNDEKLSKLYLQLVFEGGLETDSANESVGVIPYSFEKEITAMNLTYKQVLKGLKEYLRG